MHPLAERVLAHIQRQELLRAGDRVGMAVSGGIDSVALLRLLLELPGELGMVLSVVHFNHQLRGRESDVDQEFVAGLAREYDLEFYFDGDDTARYAAEEHSSLEATARELRYGFFRHLLGADEDGSSTSGAKAPINWELDRSAKSAAPPQGGDHQGLKPPPSMAAYGTTEVVPFPSSILPAAEAPAFSNADVLNKIATGHTLDDQAETVLMRMIRGAGLRGLRGIHPRMAVEADRGEDDAGEISGEIIRPLLGIRRRELERYLKDIGQSWREDLTNAEAKFTRNRMRQMVLPLLEREFNPSVAENLAELAEIARAEEDYWENEVAGWMGTTIQWSRPEWTRRGDSSSDLVQIQRRDPRSEDSEGVHPPAMNASVSRVWLLSEPIAVQRRVIKAIGEQAGIPLEFRHIEEIIRMAADDASGRELSLPLRWKFVAEPESLLFVASDPSRQESASSDYEYDLRVPGQVSVPEVRTVFEAIQIAPGAPGTGDNPQQHLDPELLPGHLRVRNWRPGDRFWPAHTKSPKKIKELLQERHISLAERRFWPVVVNGDDIVWVRGFATPQSLHAKADGEAVLIRETPFGEEER